MALKGTLRDFPTSQLLNLIHLSRKTGLLTIQGAETARLWFREGQLIYALRDDDKGLAEVIRRSRRPAAGRDQLIEPRAGGDKELAHHLIQAGFTTQNNILEQIEQYVRELVYHAFRWQDGSFTFAANEFPSPVCITVSLSLEEVILEGKQRLEEWEQLQQTIPSLDVAFKFAGRPKEQFQQFNFSPKDWRVLSYIDPRNTLRQIAETNRMSDLEIRRTISDLFQAGVIEPVDSRHSNLNPPAETNAGASGADERSLLDRFRDRLRR